MNTMARMGQALWFTALALDSVKLIMFIIETCDQRCKLDSWQLQL